MLKLGELYEKNNMVCSYENGKLFNPKRFSSKFNELLVKNELPKIRFHDLRHSHASLLGVV
jgi:integrase